jgi:2-polyprenyl-6-methoxyphenol hydroxylase-like FAD-dependent oxidoreductase
MRIVVVGAGLSGSLLAQSLTGAGIDVALYEREAAGQAQGYRIHIAPDGDLALRACLPADLYEQVLATAAGRRGSGWRVLDPALNVVQETLVPETPGEREHGRHLTVDRLTLRRILVTGLDVRYATPFRRYELLDDGRVRVFLGDGTVEEADLLVGADGTHSRVRGQLLPHAEVMELGIAEIFGRTPLTDEARALAPAAALDGFCVVTGTDGRFMPLAAHEFLPGAEGTGDDYLMWVVAGPAAMFPADLSTMDKSALQKTAADLVSDWHPGLSEIVRLGDPGSVHTTTIRTARPVRPWATVPVTLMGDAIHTMVPQGTSSSVALRDAALLYRRVTEGPLLDGVRAYEAEMLEYGFAEVERSLRSASNR